MLAFLAPEFAAVDPATVVQALTFAESYRPRCLPQARQDEATALYAAWLLGIRAGGYGDSENTSIFSSYVLSEKEGDLQRTYPTLAQLGLTAADIGNYKARFDALYKICSYGGLITRYG